MESSEQLISNAIRTVVNRHSNMDEMKPAWVAIEAYKELDPDSQAPLLVKFSSLRDLRQGARQELRGMFDPVADGNPNQHELWPTLQTRYPIAKQNSDAEPTYVKLELLTSADALWNIRRLRREADTKIKHANALEQWAAERGLLVGQIAA